MKYEVEFHLENRILSVALWSFGSDHVMPSELSSSGVKRLCFIRFQRGLVLSPEINTTFDYLSKVKIHNCFESAMESHLMVNK